MNIQKLISNLAFVATLATLPLAAQIENLNFNQKHHHDCGSHHDYALSYGKLSASATIGNLVIVSPQTSLPPTTGYQPFPVDTFSTYSRATALDPTDATITVANAGTYQVNALLTLAFPTPGSNGPDDLTGYVIAIVVNGQLQEDSIGSLHISTEAGGENPGLLFSASLSDLITVPANSTIQFVIAGGTGSASPAYMVVTSANATVAQIDR